MLTSKAFGGQSHSNYHRNRTALAGLINFVWSSKAKFAITSLFCLETTNGSLVICVMKCPHAGIAFRGTQKWLPLSGATYLFLFYLSICKFHWLVFVVVVRLFSFLNCFWIDSSLSLSSFQNWHQCGLQGWGLPIQFTDVSKRGSDVVSSHREDEGVTGHWGRKLPSFLMEDHCSIVCVQAGQAWEMFGFGLWQYLPGILTKQV